ncbi:hypothetical protein DCE93_11975 [Agromyces badenianii]|uniref:DUF4279 domain-containing protein n=1 Tax=Agromyces badenianii TaxID=2080742 RepID=A0A2S0WY90_9MICO|nr:DUF4279 domain-containing protein [Agromyces badenianii]AWB96278.1 hypothetical protein DCE93_11975 [Agromyces badenianii]
MIQSGRASLTVVSTETDPALISEILGLVPTRVALRGSVRRSGRPLEHNVWTIDVEQSPNADADADETGTQALRDLVTGARPAIGKLSRLPDDCDAKIWWSADSDSTQGGFVLRAELAASIAELGVDVYATVYLEGGESTEAEQ